jgi:predicted NBD/HSP70 family sugar kinase
LSTSDENGAAGMSSSKQTSRNISRSQVLGVIRAERSISRSKLASMVPMSRATVSGIVAEMMEVGIIEEVGEGVSTGGRPPIKLRYNPESRMAVGAVLFDDQIQTALTDMEGNLLNYLEIPIAGGTPSSMLSTMHEAVECILEGIPRDHVLGVGIGAPGIVDFETGVIELSVSRGWLEGGIEVKSPLASGLQLPVYVANRSRVAALGEFQVGIGRDVSNLIYLFLGRGIVAGVIIDGHLYIGPGSSAGEIGHVSVDPDGPLCDCGNHGCLEVFATEVAILAEARALARENAGSLLHHAVDGRLERLTIDHVIEAANRSDPSALGVLADAGTKVGFAVSVLIDLFNPEMVIIGGPLGTNAGNLLLEPIRREAQLRTLSRPFMDTQIVTGILGSKAIAIGAAVLAINHTPIEVILGK